MARYDSSVNKKVASLLDSLLKIDYRRTNRVNNGSVLLMPVYGLQWLHNNKKQFKVLQGIIAKEGYPGERVAGLPAFVTDSANEYTEFIRKGPEVVLQDRRAEFMLIHYFSNRRRDINEMLWPGIATGYLDPRFYAVFNDFMAQANEKHYAYYCQWHCGRDTANNTTATDTRRAAIGLNTIATHRRNMQMYTTRLKNRTVNEAIIMEE
jgi:hypothetical protein